MRIARPTFALLAASSLALLGACTDDQDDHPERDHADAAHEHAHADKDGGHDEHTPDADDSTNAHDHDDHAGHDADDHDHPADPAQYTALSADETYRISWTSDPSPISNGTPFDLTITIAYADSEDPPASIDVSADAWMPAHSHGMNVTPVITPLNEPGAFRAEGLLFHMPGLWRIFIDITEDAITERASFDLEID